MSSVVEGTNRTILILCLIAIGLEAESVESYSQGFEGKERAHKGGTATMLFNQMDADHNEIVTPEEADQFHKQRFLQADGDVDGKLSLKEFLTAEDRDVVRQQIRQNLLTDKFNRADKDRDGTLTLAEVLEMGSKRFKQMDENGDGKVTKDELGVLWKKHLERS
jgi:hypothetical protein